MSENWQYRFMEPGEESKVCDLVLRVFAELIGPLFSPAGVREFTEYVQPAALLRRSQTGNFVLVATTPDEMVGMIEVRGNEHICLLFVDQRYQRQGIARELLRRALEIGRRHRPDLREVTVNSSPNSVHIYEKLGFRREGHEAEVSGIRFTPMVFDSHQFPQ